MPVSISEPDPKVQIDTVSDLKDCVRPPNKHRIRPGAYTLSNMTCICAFRSSAQSQPVCFRISIDDVKAGFHKS